MTTPDAHGQQIELLWAQVNILTNGLDQAVRRIASLEKQTPQARQLQYEADVAAADAAGYDADEHRGHTMDTDCPYCGVPPEER